MCWRGNKDSDSRGAGWSGTVELVHDPTHSYGSVIPGVSILFDNQGRGQNLGVGSIFHLLFIRLVMMGLAIRFDWGKTPEASIVCWQVL